MSNLLIKEDIITDEVKYVAIYQDFAIELLDFIQKQTPYENYVAHREFFSSPGVFDGLVNVLAQELRKSPMRPHLCDSKARKVLIE